MDGGRADANKLRPHLGRQVQLAESAQGYFPLLRQRKHFECFLFEANRGVDSGRSHAYNRSKVKRLEAVIETSFWSPACRVGLDAYLWDFYARPIWVPQAVVEEVTGPQRQPWVSVDQRRMELALEDERLALPRISYKPYPQFGKGERHAIGLASALHAVLLINDHRPYRVARGLGIDVVSVPEFVVLLCRAKTINVARSQVLLDQIRDVTAPALVERAIQLLEGKGRETDAKGDRNQVDKTDSRGGA